MTSLRHARADRAIAKGMDFALLVARATKEERATILVHLEQHERTGTCGGVEQRLVRKLIDAIKSIKPETIG